jgi:hypothetical protein
MRARPRTILPRDSCGRMNVLAWRQARITGSTQCLPKRRNTHHAFERLQVLAEQAISRLQPGKPRSAEDWRGACMNAAGKMDVNFQPNVITGGAAASGTAGASGPVAPGVDADSPSASGFQDVMQQMRSNYGTQENGSALTIPEKLSATHGTAKLPSNSAATSSVVSASAASSSIDGSTPDGAPAGSNRASAAGVGSYVLKSELLDEASGLASFASDSSAGIDGSPAEKKPSAKQSATGILSATVMPGASPLMAASGAMEVPLAGAVNGPPCAPSSGSLKRAASVPDTTCAVAETTSVTTTAAGAIAAKTPASLSSHAATSAEVSASLQDAAAARPVATTATAPAPPAAMTATQPDSATIPSREHNKTAESGANFGASEVAPQTQTPSVTVAGAASAAAMEAGARLITSGRPETKEFQSDRSIPKSAGNAGQSSPASLTVAMQDTKMANIAGAHVTSGTAAQGTAGADSAATRQHSNSSGQNNHPDSSPVNSDKGSTATGKSTANETGAGVFGAQVAAPHEVSGHASAANPLTVSVSSGGTNSSTAATAVQAGRAGTPNGGPFTPKAIAGQRDAGVAGGVVPSVDAAVAGAYGAQMLGKAGRSEMRIQFEAEGLGPVELRAAAAGNTIGATITTDRPETHWLLANGVGNLHQALADHNVQVERIDILLNSPGNGGRPGGGGANTGNGGGAYSNERAPARPWPGSVSAGISTIAPEEATTSSVASLYREGRLSVRV